MPSFLLFFPIITLIFLNLIPRETGRRIALSSAVFSAALQIILILLPVFGIWSNRLWVFGSFFNFKLVVDPFSAVMLFSIGIVLLSALCCLKPFIIGEKKIFNFVNLVLIIQSGMNGIVMVRDLFSFYVFLEVTAVSSFILISIHRDIEAYEATFKYLMLSVIATVLMLCSISLLLFVAGGTSFEAIASGIKLNPQNNPLVLVALGLFLCAAFIKGGLMPFHGWLPDAYSASTAPVSILLAGIVTKTSGIYILIRLITAVFGFTPALLNVLLFVGTISIVLAALAALTQSDFKRMLAYSSISQVGYIIIGLGSGTSLGVFGAIFHLFNHAIFKTLLFANSAAVESRTGLKNIDKFSGLAQNMPYTGTTSVLASLSCAGIPPLAGFWSKLVIIIALWSAGFHVYALIAALASLLTLSYMLALQRKVFFGKSLPEFANIKEAGSGIVFSEILLAVITIAGGAAFPLAWNSLAVHLARAF